MTGRLTMSGHKILKTFGHFVVISILLNSCICSSNAARNRRFSLDDLDHKIVGLRAGVPIASSAVQILDDWCGNLTKHLNATVEKFENITFNSSLATYSISSGVKLLQRVTYDLSHIKVYSLLFGEIPSSMTGQQFNLCLQEGVRQTKRLTTGMEMAERILNGTSSMQPGQRPIHSTSGIKIHSTSGKQFRYQDILREIAIFKSQMRELVIIIGTYVPGSNPKQAGR
ncbi:PREDICTED: uncharacterized protein LOC107344464 [Acropora digitifera]|uniref:uncharacterized protein LOC107344464 n=1 Tax=Acropora digitifera TaxID=70779 RepID=UPI00077A0074|nr:PREDICTED: uncharacterized protein LOC107344464 [Acropora digitifera]